ncbi:MAG: AAA family ATPase [bacterium]|nr:AAA family ATPase [bacterium]
MPYLAILAALVFAAILVVRALRQRPRTRPAEPATPPAPRPAAPSTPEAPPAPTTSIYAAIGPLGEAFNIVAHPSELSGHPAMTATLALLRDPGVTDQRLLDLAYGDHNGLRCAAFLAMAERGAAFTATTRVIDDASTLPPWYVWFALRAIAACAPPQEPVTGRLLTCITIDAGGRGWSANPSAVDHLRGFVQGRLAGGETPGFTDEEWKVIERHGNAFDLRRLLERISTELMAGWLAALDEREGAPEAGPVDAATPTDRREAPPSGPLSELGRVWGRIPATAGRRLLPMPAQAALVERLRRNLEATPPRPSLLVGEPGAGKRAVVEALAVQLRNAGWRILEAGHADIIANQKYVGDMEGRLQLYLRELGRPQRLWFIPDLGELRSTGAHDQRHSGALHQLLSHFEAGDVRVVGTMTPSAWEALQQALPAARGVFDVLKLEPLDDTAAMSLARAWLTDGGETAGPQPGDERVVDEAWLLARQFLGDRAAPGNLLQLLDRARRRVQAAGDRATFDRADLIAALSELTGLPTAFLDDRQGFDLQSVRAFFRERVLGQDEAVECLVHRIAMLKAGLGDPSRPQGVFLFAGPTGTGKTEIAKVLADYLFGSPDRLVRLDMSEYNERGAAARLLRAQAQAGGTGSPLVSRIRQRPFSVVLLDEFEKAAPDVWDLFLQVADDGRLTDDQGETVDFRHTIIILTSNLGARLATGTGVGFSRAVDGFRPQDVEKAVEKSFRREFVNRLDRIVIFRPFTRETMRELLRLEIRKAEGRRGLRQRDWATIWDDSAVDFLLERGFTVDLGARPLRRAVERYLLEPLATTITQGRNPGGDQFLYVHADGDRLALDFIDPDAPAEPAVAAAPAATGDEALTPQQVLLGGRGGPRELAALAATHAALVERLEADDLRRRKSEALAAMNGPDFWDDDGRFAVLELIENIDRVESGLQGAGQLLERLAFTASARRGAASPRAVPADLVAKLAGSLHLLEAALGALERDATWDAYLLVDAAGDGAQGGPDADAWARRVATMYERWAAARRLKREVLLEAGGAAGRSWRQVASISGYGACPLLDNEGGLHVWEEPDPRREGGFRRQQALVRVVAQPSRAPADRAAALREAEHLLGAAVPDRLRLVRHYRELPSPLVRDRIRGWRSGRLERVLDGAFDLISGEE